MVRKNALLHLAIGIVLVASIAAVAQPEYTPDHSTTGRTHGGMACGDCHETVADIGATAVVAKNPDRTCGSCHNATLETANSFAAAFHRDKSRRCSSCHSFHETSEITAAGSTFTYSKKSGMGLCAACHNGSGGLDGLSEGHRLAALLFHSNSELLKDVNASTACMVCHATNRVVTINGIAVGNIPQFSDQHTHPLGEVSGIDEVRNTTRIRTTHDPRLPLFDNRMECQTCHQLNAPTQFRLVAFDTPRELCLGCHEVKT